MAGSIGQFFALAERGSTVRTEVTAGLTTYLTMAYIVAVNPVILGAAGMPPAGVAAATCLAAGLASILMGLWANVPLALAPGMGLNAYFAYVVVLGGHVPWPAALAAVFIAGFAFLVLTLTGLRQALVAALPPHLNSAVAGGIGLFIGLIGLKNAGLVVASPATMVALGPLASPAPLLALAGLLLTTVLIGWRVRGAMLFGIAATTLTAALAGQIHASPQPYTLSALTSTALRIDFAGFLRVPGAAGIVLTFLFVALFDNLGTLVAVLRRAGLAQGTGQPEGLNRILMADAVAGMAGATLGTSTVTSYIESAAGVEAGGRTGLTAITTGLLFLATALVAPWAQLVPAAATAPALVLVGAMMLAPLAEVAWTDPLEALPAFLTVALIPFTFSIATGLAFGIAAHALLKLARGRLDRGDGLLLALAVLIVWQLARGAA